MNEDYNSVSLLYSSNKLQRFEVYIENYAIGIVRITNVRNDMQAVELLIKIWNKI